MNKVLLASAVAAALAVAAPFAGAQSSEAVEQVRERLAAASAAGAAEASGTPRAAPQRRAFSSATERVEARLAYIRTALKITDTQQPQWNAFAETRRKQAREATERMEKFRAQRAERQMGSTPPTAVQRLERRQVMLAAASTRLNETLAATKPLYAALSPEQQKIADEVLVPRGRGGFHRRGGHGGHGRA